jgi:hypothetical protein
MIAASLFPTRRGCQQIGRARHRERAGRRFDALVKKRPQKIAFAEMRSSGVRGLFIYCGEYQCSHSIKLSADRWPDHVRLSDFEPCLFVSPAARGAPTSGLISTGTKSRRAAWAIVPWSSRFDDPIPLPNGRKLVTLDDAGNYITELLKAEYDAPEWQAAMEALIALLRSYIGAKQRGSERFAGVFPPQLPSPSSNSTRA